MVSAKSAPVDKESIKDVVWEILKQEQKKVREL